MKELSEQELLELLNIKTKRIEDDLRRLTTTKDDLKKLTAKHDIAIQGLKAISESGDCGGIAEKTIKEINNII